MYLFFTTGCVPLETPSAFPTSFYPCLHAFLSYVHLKVTRRTDFAHLITLTWSIFFLPLFYPPKPNPLAHSPSELRSYAPLVDSSLRDANRSVLPLNSEIYLRCRSSRLPSSQVLDSTVGRSLASLLVLAGSPLCCFLHPTTSGFFREIQSCDAISQRWQALLQD